MTIKQITLFTAFTLISVVNTSAQKPKDNSPIYSICENAECFGIRSFSLADTTKLRTATSDCVAAGVPLLPFRTGRIKFSAIGTWHAEGNEFTFESKGSKRDPATTTKYVRLTKEYYTVLLPIETAGDSTAIMDEIEKDFKASDSYKRLESILEGTKPDIQKRLLTRSMHDFIQREFSWKYKLLIKAL